MESGFVFINNSLDNVEPDSKKFKRKTIRVRAARQTPLTEALQSLTPIKSASKWNRYQARIRTRQKIRLNTFPLDTSILEQPGVRRDALGSEDDSSNGKPSNSSLDTGGPSLIKSESVSSSEWAAGPVPSRLGGGWVAPFVPLESLSKSYCPLLLEHCMPYRSLLSSQS